MNLFAAIMTINVHMKCGHVSICTLKKIILFLLLQDIDETLAERLMALEEMLPNSLRNVVSKVTKFTCNSTVWLYGTGRLVMWVVASSAVVLALPVMFETERAQMEEQQLQQQRQV